MTHQAIAVDVVRAVSAAPELRATKDGGNIGLLTGHFSRFNNWYRVSSIWEGDFLERTAPGFTEQTIAEDRGGMRVLFNHGFDSQAGDKVLGPIQDLREDETGVYYEVPLFDTSYNRDLLPGLKAGVYGASFRMHVEADSWDDEPGRSEYNPKGIPERTITRAKVAEFGPVTFPANPEASANVRSTTDEFYEGLRHRNRGAFEAACRAANPDFAGQRARSATGGRNGEPGQGDPGKIDDRPGNGAVSARTEAQARHHRLILNGVIRNG